MDNKRPNIVFFFTDDQRYNTIGCLNNDEIKTPNIDFLVKNGSYFNNAYIPGATSGAVCMPSRAMLHTGKSLFHLQGRGETIPKNHALLGETLQKNGYETIGIGKWHNGIDSYSRSFSDGDKIFFGGMDDHWNVPVHSFDPTKKYEGRKIKSINYLKSNETNVSISNNIYNGIHSSDLFGEAACKYLVNKKSENPFFMYLSFMAPHDPRTMPKRFLDMYDIEDIKLPKNYLQQHPFNYGIENIRDELLEKYPRTKEKIKQHILEYYAMISHLDYNIGKVIRELKEQGEYENTIFILAGDNGLALGQHGLMGKQNLYEHSIKVPLLFCGQNIPKSKISNAFIYLYDLFPTICDVLEIDIPSTVGGLSFKNAIFKDEKNRDTMSYAYMEQIRAIRKGDYKLIEYRRENLSETQLFNTTIDPYEIDNLSYNNISKVDELRKVLQKESDVCGDMNSKYGKIFWSNFYNNMQ